MPNHEIHETIKTRNLQLVDRNDNVRATFSAEYGTPTLELQDNEGKYRLSLAIEKSGRIYLQFYGKDARARISIEISEDGDPYIILYDDNGNVIWGQP